MYIYLQSSDRRGLRTDRASVVFLRDIFKQLGRCAVEDEPRRIFARKIFTYYCDEAITGARFSSYDLTSLILSPFSQRNFTDDLVSSQCLSFRWSSICHPFRKLSSFCSFCFDIEGSNFTLKKEISRENLLSSENFIARSRHTLVLELLNKQFAFRRGLFVLTIASSFLRNVRLADDFSSFARKRRNRVFLRIMKPIFAARTANVKVNEGFWSPRAQRETYIFREFRRKISALQEREMGPVVLRPTCPLSLLYAPCGFRLFCLIYRQALSHPFISALFNTIFFLQVVPRLFAILHFSPFLAQLSRESELFVSNLLSFERSKISLFPHFQLQIRVREKKFVSPLLDLSIPRL